MFSRTLLSKAFTKATALAPSTLLVLAACGQVDKSTGVIDGSGLTQFVVPGSDATAVMLSGSQVTDCTMLDVDSDGVVDGQVWGYSFDGDPEGHDPMFPENIYDNGDGTSYYLCIVSGGAPVANYVNILSQAQVGDCDDENAAISDVATYYQDSDEDGYGNLGANQLACGQPVGYVIDSTDCDDAVFATHPGATEVCNGVDDDCANGIDDGVTMAVFADDDGDGAGNPDMMDAACGTSEGWVDNSTDCDDADNTAFPGNPEACDGVDNDCANGIDDGLEWFLVYPDLDTDGYGDETDSGMPQCTMPDEMQSEDNTDCDDGDMAVNPDGVEIPANGKDDDCVGGDAAEPDADGDSDPDSTDCDDSSPAINHGATEVCNGVDDNCDGGVDEGVQTTFYADADSDGYGGSSTAMSCSAPSGYVATSTDCNDAVTTINPGASEACNGLDDNCSGVADEGLLFSDYSPDVDGDGYGDPNEAVVNACAAPANYAEDATDCNDAVFAVNPGVAEVANSGYDDNCDGIYLGFCTSAQSTITDRFATLYMTDFTTDPDIAVNTGITGTGALCDPTMEVQNGGDLWKQNVNVAWVSASMTEFWWSGYSDENTETIVVDNMTFTVGHALTDTVSDGLDWYRRVWNWSDGSPGGSDIVWQLNVADTNTAL